MAVYMREGCERRIANVEPYAPKYNTWSLLSTVRSEHAIYNTCQIKYILNLYS
jgi:hypothetical protein